MIHMSEWHRLAALLSRKMTLNEAQEQALTSTHNVSILAAAGSGKTRILTTRYLLHLLAEPEIRPENIVAITFTDNAAAEMRRRIREYIDSLIMDEEFCDYAPRLEEIKLWLSMANISTIHSFCLSILSRYSIDAAIVPGFTTITETSQHVLFSELVDLILREINEGDIECLSYEERLDLARHLSGKRLGEIILKILQHRAKIVNIMDTLEQRAAEVLEIEHTDKDKISLEFELYITGLVARVIRHAFTKYHQLKEQDLLLDFDDLLINCDALLAERPDITNALARTFRYFLVDEFQDTNPLQWKIIRRLSAARDDRLNPDKVFIVGDPKQSIYGFRDADVRIFYQACDDIRRSLDEKSEETQIIMNKNYRARQCLIDFTNFLFSRVMSGDTSAERSSFEVEYQPLVKGVPDKDASPGRVEFIFAVTDTTQQENLDMDKSEKEIELITRKIVQLINASESPYTFGDIAILLRWKTHLVDLETSLRQHNIPYVTVGGIGFYQRQEIWDIYNLLSFLLNQNDDIALVGVLRSPLFAFSDDLLYKIARLGNKETTFWNRLVSYSPDSPDSGELNPEEDDRVRFALSSLKHWIRRAPQLDPVILLDEICERTGYLVSQGSLPFGKYLLANIAKMYDMAQRSRSIAEFGESLTLYIQQEVREAEAQPELTEENAVKLMTIHRAKGLEFPVVFLPFLEKKFSGYKRDSIRIDEEIGVGYKIRNPSKQMTFDDSVLYRVINEREEERVLAEEKRLLYVACTRAEEHLILCASYDLKSLKSKKSSKNSLPETPKSALDLFCHSFDIPTVQLTDMDTISFTGDIQNWDLPVIHEIEESDIGVYESSLTEPEIDIGQEEVKKYRAPLSRPSRELTISVTDIKRFIYEPALMKEALKKNFSRREKNAIGNLQC